jgi:hypothetical protein
MFFESTDIFEKHCAIFQFSTISFHLHTCVCVFFVERKTSPIHTNEKVLCSENHAFSLTIQYSRRQQWKAKTFLILLLDLQAYTHSGNSNENVHYILNFLLRAKKRKRERKYRVKSKNNFSFFFISMCWVCAILWKCNKVYFSISTF